jgi:hypothetical protein
MKARGASARCVRERLGFAAEPALGVESRDRARPGFGTLRCVLSGIERLGILRLSAIGDVVHAMPLAMGLRRAYPAARITWVAQAEAAPLLDAHPAVDDVLVYPRRGGPRTWAAFLRALRARRFDATVDPQGNWKSGVVGLLSGARVNTRNASTPVSS